MLGELTKIGLGIRFAKRNNLRWVEGRTSEVYKNRIWEVFMQIGKKKERRSSVAQRPYFIRELSHYRCFEHCRLRLLQKKAERI